MRHLVWWSLGIQKQLPQRGDWVFDFSHTNTIWTFSSFYLWCCWITTPFITNTARGCSPWWEGISQHGAVDGEQLKWGGLCLGQLALSKQDTTKNTHFTNLGPENWIQRCCWTPHSLCVVGVADAGLALLQVREGLQGASSAPSCLPLTFLESQKGLAYKGT